MNLPKFKVVGDPKNPPMFSSSIIIESLNKAAKNIGLYSEKDFTVVYDCICNTHEYKADAIISCYEVPYPAFIANGINNAKIPLFTVSKDNLRFALDGGCSPDLCSYINLGVDTSIWTPVIKKPHDKFIVLSYTESLVRSGLEILVDACAKSFYNRNHLCQLYIKDRNATPEFEFWIKNKCDSLGIDLKYENKHISNVKEVREMFSEVDCHVYLNRSTTWGMTVLEGMACGVPTIAPAYSGPREFLVDKFNGLAVNFEIIPVVNEIQELINNGQRNFFFPLRTTDYWCKPNVDSVAQAISAIRDNPYLSAKLGRNASLVARQFSWERAALMLAEGLDKYYPL